MTRIFKRKNDHPTFIFSSSDWNRFFWPYRIFFGLILYPNYSCIPCSASNTKPLHALSKITNFASLKSKPRADQYTAREGGLPNIPMSCTRTCITHQCRSTSTVMCNHRKIGFYIKQIHMKETNDIFITRLLIVWTIKEHQRISE